MWTLEHLVLHVHNFFLSTLGKDAFTWNNKVHSPFHNERKIGKDNIPFYLWNMIWSIFNSRPCRVAVSTYPDVRKEMCSNEDGSVTWRQHTNIKDGNYICFHPYVQMHFSLFWFALFRWVMSQIYKSSKEMVCQF